MSATIEIAGRRIGPGQPAFIIAELSANHGQDYAQAEAIVRAAKTAGADAIKFQTYTPDTITIDSDREWFRIGPGTRWAGRVLHELYAEAHMPWDWQPRLQAVAHELGLCCFSTPFDDSAVEFLEKMKVPAWKIASFELVDLPLIRRVARTGKPLIMSTGMATLAEIEEAVQAARVAGAAQIALLKCTSGYPADPAEMNLRTIPHLADAFGVAVGLSDHTLGSAVPVAAIALGACIVEKHFTHSRSVPGPDSAFSLEPQEFKQMVDDIRMAEQALGVVHYGVTEREGASRVFRRSIFVVEDVPAGEIFTPKNVRCIRPGYGLHPRHLEEILGRRASRDVAKGTPMSFDLLGK